MRKLLFILLLLLFSTSIQAQEFKCNVSVDASGLRGSNKQIFKALERSVEEFVNTNKWTEKRFLNHEKIKCDIIFNVKSYDAKNNNIQAEIYFRSYRPVYKSDYQTLLVNLIDKNFNFEYREFEKIDFNIEMFDSNLASNIAFYLYIALGHDFESFKQGAGKDFFDKAKLIQSNAVQNIRAGWEANNDGVSKGDLIELIEDQNSKYYLKAIYTYHRWGLDKMADNLNLGKSNIITAINYLAKLKTENRDAGMLIKVFFDAKADEITQIFKQGPPVNLNYIVNKLNDLAPNYSFKWDEIKGKSRPKSGFGRNPRSNTMPPGAMDKMERLEKKGEKDR